MRRKNIYIKFQAIILHPIMHKNLIFTFACIYKNGRYIQVIKNGEMYTLNPKKFYQNNNFSIIRIIHSYFYIITYD